MPSLAMTSATTKLYITTTMPATFDETGYEAIPTASWILIGECDSLGQVGGTTAIAQHKPIDTGVVVKRAGSVDYGQMQCSMARHAGTDVDAIRAAFKARSTRAFWVRYPTLLGQSDYFTGIITSTPTMIGGTDDILKMQFNIDVDSEIIYATT